VAETVRDYQAVISQGGAGTPTSGSAATALLGKIACGDEQFPFRGHQRNHRHLPRTRYAARFLRAAAVRECRNRLLCEAAERPFLRNACVVARERRKDGFRLREDCPLFKSRFA
jgi:hypothetical protein